MGKPALCLVNKMDSGDADKNFAEFLTQMNDNRNEDYLRHLPEEARPEKLINFHEIIPISAKCNQASVKFVKDKLRTVIDEVENQTTNADQKISQLALSFDKFMEEKNPKIY